MTPVQFVHHKEKLRQYGSALKELVSLLLRSRVVHEDSCVGCNALYIEKTVRHLTTRLREHSYKAKVNNQQFQQNQQKY